MKLLIIGPQGSGKGTQAEILSEKLRIPHISTGDIFRSLQGPLKKKVDEIINKGNLVPDELTLEILKNRLEKEDCKKGFILDGFPRNLNQARLLKKITKIDKVIEITLDDKTAIKRITGRRLCKKCKINYNIFTEPKPKNPEICDECGGKLVRRKDDTENAVKKRLEIYKKETLPVLKEYDNILTINGNQSIKEMTEEIINNLELKTD
ncbi:adenylate kinase [Candidatus Pacearchaeota archaeon]|nr:adenylate kinase [Candidatus Pacearchaeota archaeon]MBD3282986.1 adenylate kinase [Candidatus Pacearchaeota archaeon]